MKREVKFRAWLKEEKVMIKVPIIDFREGWRQIKTTVGQSVREWKYNFADIELLEFTGLLDKNDRPIYEGDIMKVEGFNPEQMVVEFREGAFCLAINDKYDNSIDIHYSQSNKAEVVGNIYENPNLLNHTNEK